MTRARTRAQRKAILNEAGNNEPQEDDRAGDFGDDVFLSPIRAGGGGGDETEARRKFTPNSRPTSPLLRSGVTMPDNGGQTPSGAGERQTPLPLVGGVQGTHTVDVRSSETLLELARQRAIWRWHARRNGPS